jgi:endonuclease YncB( thermonuclease family)
MKRTVLLGLLLALYTLPALGADNITGRARAIDGDTMKVGGVEIRLFGVDAPELKQTCTTKKGKVQRCGDLARQMLNTLTMNVKVKCRPQGLDKDGAIVAICFSGPFDINEQMVSSGWALPLPEETEAYIRARKFASARSEGMWRGTFIPPQQWRQENGMEE